MSNFNHGKTYVYHQDPGHGWLAVKVKELFELGIQYDISNHSYVQGNTVYLEEDCDAMLFISQYQACYGHQPNLRHSYRERSPVRNYDRYSPAAVKDQIYQLVEEA